MWCESPFVPWKPHAVVLGITVSRANHAGTALAITTAPMIPALPLFSLQSPLKPAACCAEQRTIEDRTGIGAWERGAWERGVVRLHHEMFGAAHGILAATACIFEMFWSI